MKPWSVVPGGLALWPARGVLVLVHGPRALAPAERRTLIRRGDGAFAARVGGWGLVVLRTGVRP